MNWINEYFAEGNTEIEMNIRLTYFNTSSSRAILDLLRLLKSYQDSRDYKVIVNWYYPNPDYDEMKAEAEDYIDETGLMMNLIPYAV